MCMRTVLRGLFRTDEGELKEKPEGSRRISYGTSVTIFFFFWTCEKLVWWRQMRLGFWWGILSESGLYEDQARDGILY